MAKLLAPGPRRGFLFEPIWKSLARAMMFGAKRQMAMGG
jgi:hypothetical protein